MKKLLALFLSVVVILSACGNEDELEKDLKKENAELKRENEDFEDIFNRAVNLFNKQKYRGFIDSKNIKFIFNNITRVNGDTIILKYFRDKYKNKNLNKYYNSIGIDF